MTTRSGYIIANRGWPDDVKLGMGAHTFGASAVVAWLRHIGPTDNYGPDFSVLVQRWSDRGYGPHKATLTLEAGE